MVCVAYNKMYVTNIKECWSSSGVEWQIRQIVVALGIITTVKK